VKLAFISSLAPTRRPDTGFEIANAAIIDALRAQGHAVTVFAFARPADDLKPDADLVLLDRMVIENSAASPARKLAWLGASLVRGLPVAAAKLWLAGRGRVVEAVRRHGPFDGLVLNSVMMPGAFPELCDLAPCILVAHNLEHVSAAQNAAHAASRPMRLLFAREARLLKALETSLVRKSAFIWCLAEEDRKVLASLSGDASGSAPLAVLPLVSTSTGRHMARTTPPAHDIGLIGTWTWEPNLIGLQWFLTEVAPRLPQGLRIAVAGRVPDGLSAPQGVTLMGRVPDAAAFLDDCAVVALSSRAGTGVQLKTIETLQLGLPAVATPLSMRGLAGIPANLRVADGAEGFAAALASHVNAVHSGTIGRIDGSAFMQAQAGALSQAIATGLRAVAATDTLA
jgi:Glycosyl transferases group 1